MATRQDEQFPLAVSTDNFRPLIARAINSCKQPLATMVQMHDAIYGGGGATFLTGAYFNDLERAVRKVLATDIATARSIAEKQENDRKAAEARALAERLEAESKAKAAQVEKVALLEKSRDLIREKMLACIGREGASMVLTDEKAEVVAKASMIFCQGDVDALLRSSMEIAETEGETASNPQALREAMEKRVLDVVTAYVVKARGELIEKTLKRPPAPPASPPQGPPA